MTPYPSEGSYTSESREVAVSETWDSWSNPQSSSNVEVVDGSLQLEFQESLIPDSVVWQTALDWDSARSESGVSHSGATVELASSSGTAPDLHYSFTETSGSTIADQTGNGNDGTVRNSVTLDTAGIESTSGLEITSDAGIEMGDIINEAAGTFTFWINPNSHYDHASVIDNSIDSDDWESWINGNGDINWRPGSLTDNGDTMGGSNRSGVDSGVPTGTWTHVALTWEEENIGELYLDGTRRDFITTSSSFDPAGDAYIGTGGLNDAPDNQYDEFRWYDQRLNESGIQDDMNAGASAIGGSYVTSGSLVTSNKVL